ncbi:hypothetical protein ACFODN_12865, partial [Rodentibacter caecimuris]
SFLGIGVQPPTASWGNIIFENQTYFTSAPWLVFIPGVAIILLALADGTLLARSPHNEQAMGVSFADDEPFRSYLHAQRSGVYWGRSPIDGVSRVIGYQRLNSIPVVVLMTLDEADAMKEWRSHARAGIVGAARVGRGDVSSGASLLMDSVAAALIGFAVLGLRRPNVFGTIVGAVFVGVLLNGLT